MNDKKDILPRVLVLGATPSGIAAANKLGELGIPVTLVDRDADLDKKLSNEKWRLSSGVPLNYAHRPGLIRILRNPGITCVLPGEVTTVKRNSQGFSVTVTPYPAYVDKERCLLCGKCEDVCPVTTCDGVKAVSAGNRMSLPGIAVIDRRRIPLCQANCPLGVKVQAYMALTSAGKFKEALAVIRKDNVLPSVCGRICTHPCEIACRRSNVDGAVSIRAIKRYLADQEDEKSAEQWAAMPGIEQRTEKIAVIGSGPAGLAAAAELALNGFQVTVYEKEEKPGGMLQYGIGEHRLPRDVLNREIEAIKSWGVQFITGTSTDLENDIEALSKKYKAILLSTGTWADRKLKVPGEDLEGVKGCLDFLTAYHRRTAVIPKGKTAVIGDGNAAFDLARTLVRLGCDVTVISWFPEEMITADKEEVKGALEEGVKLLCSFETTGFKGKKGHLSAISLVPVQPGEKDENGIAWPVRQKGAKAQDMPFETAFVSIGQVGALSSQYKFKVSERGTIVTDKSFKTDIPFVFAAGDAVTGPASVVHAMAQGRRAAGSIIFQITGKKTAFLLYDENSGRPENLEFPPIPEDLEHKGRAEMAELSPSKRKMNFKEVEKGLTPFQATLESERCLQCGVCSQCLECFDACGPAAAIKNNSVESTFTDHAGVMILADESMASHLKHMTGSDVIRTWDSHSEDEDVYSMMIRGFAAAAHAMEMLSGSIPRSRGFGVSGLSPEPVLSDEIRIGVFVCTCNQSLGFLSEMTGYVHNLENADDVFHTEVLEAACLPEYSAHIVRTVREKGLTRVVLASCVCCPLNFVCSSCTDQKSRLKKALFDSTGISRAMVETCNIRGEALRLVKTDPESALTEFVKIIDLCMNRTRKLQQYSETARNYHFTTAVIGESEGALTTASILARSGFEVILFRRKPLDDNQLLTTPSTLHCIHGAVVTEISGTLGDFRISFDANGTSRTLLAGFIVMGEKTRQTVPFKRMKNQPDYWTGFRVDAGIQRKNESGRPFLYPGLTSIPGILLTDPPASLDSATVKGAAAAILAAAIMPRGPRQRKGYTVTIDTSLCRGCGRCVGICPYSAVSMKENGIGGFCAVVDEAFCKGCGNCSAVCPSNAADSPYRNQAFFEETIEELLI